MGSAYKIPLEDNSVDVVISLETIEHLDKPEVFVSEVRRVLKSDGVFVVSTPNDDEFTEGNVFHVHEFQFPELKRIVEKNFTNVTYYFQGSYYASSLHSKENFTAEDSDFIEAYKSFSQKTNKAIFYMAVCSNNNKAATILKENAVIADAWSEKSSLEQSRYIESVIQSQTKEVLELKSAAQEKDAALVKATAELEAAQHELVLLRRLERIGQ